MSTTTYCMQRVIAQYVETYKLLRAIVPVFDLSLGIDTAIMDAIAETIMPPTTDILRPNLNSILQH